MLQILRRQMHVLFPSKIFCGNGEVYLLSQPGTKGCYILSEHFSQDPLENYFGQQRARGGRCQNPTIQACLTSAQSLRVQGSVSMTPIRGNSSRNKLTYYYLKTRRCVQVKPLLIYCYSIPYRTKLWRGENFGEFGESPQFAKFFLPTFLMKHVVMQFVS